MKGGSFTIATDCSLQQVTMDDVGWNPAEFTRCDFTKAKLNISTGSYTKAVHCIFHQADCQGANFDAQNSSRRISAKRT